MYLKRQFIISVAEPYKRYADIFPYTHHPHPALHQTAKQSQTLFATARAMLSAWFRCQGKINKG